MPKISVIMPVYNAQSYVYDAIQSVLAQTVEDFEFLIFDDGSTDNSLSIIESFQDKRIKVFKQTENGGYVPLLNKGLLLANGQYIARMDADDTCVSSRFEKQIDFLNKNREYILCGSWYADLANSGKIARLPVDDQDIRLKMLSITPFSHPSVMMRTSVFRKHNLLYKVDHCPSEDFELWTKMSLYGKMRNIPEVLLNYRFHDNNISRKVRTTEQISRRKDAQMQYITHFFEKASLDEIDLRKLLTLFTKETGYQIEELAEIGDLCERVLQPEINYPVPLSLVVGYLSEVYFYRCTCSTHLGMEVFRLMRSLKFVHPSLLNRAKLLLKSTLQFNQRASRIYQ